MNLTIKAFLSRILKAYYKNSIASKPYNGTRSNLFYEKSQHLMFAFKQKLSYEPLIQQKVKKYITPGDLVFDIGGNIGQYTLLFSDLVGDDGKVITLEPDFKNFAFLQFNVNRNNISNVVCLQKGVGDKKGTIEFFRDTETGGRMGTFNKEFAPTNIKEVENVETTTLDLLVENFGEPSFVKIDVEGFESFVLKGLTSSLSKTVFMIEVREDTKEEVFEYFRARNYHCYFIDEEKDVLMEHAKDIPYFANLIFHKPIVQ